MQVMYVNISWNLISFPSIFFLFLFFLLHESNREMTTCYNKHELLTLQYRLDALQISRILSFLLKYSLNQCFIHIKIILHIKLQKTLVYNFTITTGSPAVINLYYKTCHLFTLKASHLNLYLKHLHVIYFTPF